jgi:hypothetical protein
VHSFILRKYLSPISELGLPLKEESFFAFPFPFPFVIALALALPVELDFAFEKASLT